MFFSPLSSQFTEDGESRGGSLTVEVDEMIAAKQHSRALVMVDSIIAEESKDLPRFAYFDRFHSEEERYKISVARADIYDLQWKRIEVLSAMNDKEKLLAALEDYSSVIGYNMNKAKVMLKKLKEE